MTLLTTRIAPLCSALLLAVPPALAAAPVVVGPVPEEVSFLPGPIIPYETPTTRSWDEIQVPKLNGHPMSGRRWTLVGHIDSMGDNSIAGMDAVSALFTTHGWKVFKDDPRGGQRYRTMETRQHEKEMFANLVVYGAAGVLKVEVDVLEIGPPPITLALVPPGPAPEKIEAEKGDFPYLAPLPGGKLGKGEVDPRDFTVEVEGTHQREFVAKSSIVKSYPRPNDLSNALFIAVYVPALTKAGWTIAHQANGSDAAILAHYGQHGRNVWVYIHLRDTYEFHVADAGLQDLASSLSTDCHVAIYGVLFDFNKATLKAESDAPLEQIAALLKKKSALKVVVEGHTDNVGQDAYNQTLSESRAASVVGWLTQHGIAEARLSSKGYGMTRPVADNKTDAGRAKNRRVEISDPTCVARK